MLNASIGPKLDVFVITHHVVKEECRAAMHSFAVSRESKHKVLSNTLVAIFLL